MTPISSRIWNHIASAQRILLHCHPNTDGDSVGSVLAMAHVLIGLGKTVTVIAGDNDPLPDYLSFLPGYQTILAKDFFQINVNDFDLFLILDTGAPIQISRKGDISFPLAIPTVVIDHHVSNTAFGTENLIDTEAPATAQILYYLFKEWGIDINHNIALCLFIGIYTDTGGFKFLRTSEKTFRMAAALANKVPEFTEYIFTLENSNSPGWTVFMKIAYANIRVLYNAVAISSISYEEITHNNINRNELNTSMFAGILKSIRGWNIGIMCTEEKPGETKISFRTRDAVQYDVTKLAAALGGGGHPAAAATYLKAPLDIVFKQIQEILPRIYPTLTLTTQPIFEKTTYLKKSQ